MVVLSWDKCSPNLQPDVKNKIMKLESVKIEEVSKCVRLPTWGN